MMNRKTKQIQDTTTCCLQGARCRFKDTIHKLKEGKNHILHKRYTKERRDSHIYIRQKSTLSQEWSHKSKNII